MITNIIIMSLGAICIAYFIFSDMDNTIKTSLISVMLSAILFYFYVVSLYNNIINDKYINAINKQNITNLTCNELLDKTNKSVTNITCSFNTFDTTTLSSTIDTAYLIKYNNKIYLNK